jgi:TonB family protein
MSSLSIPRPKKMSDGQFIGDLTKLLERRKIKCGDPDSLDSFSAELASNNILRSDLFTLCTAISHMADEDLTGEQLLVLVGRAVGGPGGSNGDGTVAVPDRMRAAFLSGYEAWGKRGSEINDPLPWPPPRPTANRSEPPAPTHASEDVSDPIVSKVPAPGLRTIQEALDLARKRSPIPSPEQLPSSLGANIEGLTISELKTLLDDIEDRMSRLQPHLRELSSIVRSPAGEPRSSKTAVPSAESAAPLAARRAAPVDAPPGVGTSEFAASLGSTSEALSEAAFLARHPYLRPKRHAGADLHVVPVVDPPTAPVVEVATVAAAPQLVEAPAVAIDGPPAAAAAPLAVAPAAPLLAPTPPWVALTAGAGETLLAAPPLFTPDLEVGSDTLRITPRLVIAVVVGLMIAPAMFASVFAYRYFHPPYIIQYTDPKLAAPDLPADPLAGLQSAPTGTPSAASDSQASAGASSTRPHNGSTREDAARQARFASQQQPRASVWPEPRANAGGGETPAPARPLIASAMTTQPRPGGSAHAAASAGPQYVPSSTMIKYAVSAPKPIYPANKARGMEGTVVLQITISKQGEVTSTRTVSGPSELRSAAVQAVRTWRFKPYLLDGSPAEVITTLELPFKRP